MGEKCAWLVRNYLEDFPQLSPIVLVLKQVLFLAGLNDPYTVSSKGRTVFLWLNFDGYSISSILEISIKIR